MSRPITRWKLCLTESVKLAQSLVSHFRSRWSHQHINHKVIHIRQIKKGNWKKENKFQIEKLSEQYMHHISWLYLLICCFKVGLSWTLFFSIFFIYKPHIKTFIHVYKLFMIINYTNNNWRYETMTNRCHCSQQRRDPMLTQDSRTILNQHRLRTSCLPRYP